MYSFKFAGLTFEAPYSDMFGPVSNKCPECGLTYKLEIISSAFDGPRMVFLLECKWCGEEYVFGRYHTFVKI